MLSIIFLTLFKGDLYMSSSNNAVVSELDLSATVEQTVSELRKQYSAWRTHQAESDNMLYVLLENCLDFYYFLRQNEQYESAFKSFCRFKWTAKTKVTLLVAKAVFGENTKMVNAYAKAIEKAAENKVGMDGVHNMLGWLQSNGGVNGVIRSNNPKQSATAVMADKKEEVGRNHRRFNKVCAIKPFVNTQMAKLISGQWLLLCDINSSSGEVEVIYPTRADKIIKLVYSEFGEAIMQCDSYKERRFKVEAEMAIERAKAAGLVGEELQRIMDKAKGGDGKELDDAVA
jgi:hypothetical protein